MNIKKIFKIVSYSLLGAVMVVVSFFGFGGRNNANQARFRMPEIPQANADIPIPIPPYYYDVAGDGGDGGGGDA